MCDSCVVFYFVVVAVNVVSMKIWTNGFVDSVNFVLCALILCGWRWCDCDDYLCCRLLWCRCQCCLQRNEIVGFHVHNVVCIVDDIVGVDSVVNLVMSNQVIPNI